MEPYSVEGLGIGMPVAPNSKQYKRYKCRQSEQYEKSITCKFAETKDGATKIITILHLYNDIVIYINKSVSPAAFTNFEVDSELKRLSGRFGSSPHIESSPEGIIATWGDIKLRRLPQSDLAILTQNKNPNLGFMVDYLINFHESARTGLPVYSLGGSKGYVWIARFGKNGVKGALRFLAADPSQMKLGVVKTPEFPSPDTPPSDNVTAQNRAWRLTPPYSPLHRQGAPPSLEAIAGQELVAMEQEGGVYVVPVRLNGALTLNAVVDSGASDVSIPADVVLTLMRTKTISDEDFLGEKTYALADGSQAPSSRFRIRSLKVGNSTIENVNAIIAPANAVLLLGQSFLGKFKSWSIDNDRHVLMLRE
jgi:clan AA aspartic protease (TIGR02281 family)